MPNTVANNSPSARMQRYNQAFAAGDFESALATVQALVTDYPSQVALHWNLARVQKALGRIPEARIAIDRVLELRGDHSLALLFRAELKMLAGEDPESDLRRAIKDDPSLAAAHCLLARALASSKPAEAAAALARALELDPELPAAYVERGDVARRAAAVGFGDGGPVDPDISVSVSGQRWSRSGLRAARADYERALERKNDPRVRLKLASVLHELGEYNDALAAFDAVLALTPNDDPRHAAIVALRSRSEGGFEGDPRAAEQLLERVLAESEAPAGARAQSAAPRILPALTRADALARFGTGDADDRLAAEYAWRIRELAAEPEPKLSASRIDAYPRYMREYAERVAQELGAHGFRVIGDYESTNLRAQWSTPVLLRLYAAADGITCGSGYQIEAPQRSWLAHWWQRLTGRLRRTAVFELQTAFDDGGYLLTSNGGDGPFSYRGALESLALPPETAAAAVYSRHRARIERYRREHPHATAERVDTEERVLAMQTRVSLARRASREAIGYIDDSELAQLLGGPHAHLAAAVRAKLAQMTAAQ